MYSQETANTRINFWKKYCFQPEVVLLIDNYNMFVIITGPAADLFEADYYNDMKKALKPNGIICCQGNNIYFIFLSY